MDQSMMRYLMVWGDGYVTKPDGSAETLEVTSQFFIDNEFEERDIEVIKALAFGQSVNLIEAGPYDCTFSIVRIR